MPILIPENDPEIFDDASSEAIEGEIIPEERSAAINALLMKNGLIPPQNGEIKNVLNSNGASVEDASRTIAHVMKHGKYDASKLKAAEIIFDLHGVRDKDGKANKQTVFQFNIKDSSVNLGNVFAPLRGNSNSSSAADNFSTVDWDSEEPSDKDEVQPETKHYGQYFPAF